MTAQELALVPTFDSTCLGLTWKVFQLKSQVQAPFFWQAECECRDEVGVEERVYEG